MTLLFHMGVCLKNINRKVLTISINKKYNEIVNSCE